MITRKNLLALAITTSLAAGLVACGGGDSSEAKVDEAAATATESPAAAGDAAKKEGKCGGDKKAAAEGKCGGDKAAKEGEEKPAAH